MNDQVTLVNERDEVIGAMDKIEAHRGAGKLHRAISVFLFRKNPESEQLELLVQKRSDKKIVGAGMWANTVCGNVWPGESYEECAWRRLEVELGIAKAANEKLSLLPMTKFQYQVQCNDEFSENEIDQVFVGWFEGEATPNPEEVSEVEWVSWAAVENENARRKMAKNWAPWFEIMMKNPEIGIKDQSLF